MSTPLPPKRKVRFSIWKSDADAQFYWRCKSSNGRIIAVAGEGYKHRESAERSLASFIDHVLGNNYEVIESKKG